MWLKLTSENPLPIAHKLRLPGETFEVSETVGLALLERYGDALMQITGIKDPQSADSNPSPASIEPVSSAIGTSTSIENLALNKRVVEALQAGGITTVAELAALDDAALLVLPGIGTKAVTDIRAQLAVTEGEDGAGAE